MGRRVSENYMYLGASFIGMLLISNMIAFRLVEVQGVIFSAGVLLFPLTYIINDVITEVYGYKKAQAVIFYGFVMSTLMVGYYTVILLTPSPTEFIKWDWAYESVLTTSSRVVGASLIAFLIGSLVNSGFMVLMKKWFKGKYLALRAITSTVLGVLVDTFIFVIAAFAFIHELEVLIKLAIAQTIIKVVMEIILYPITARLIVWFKKEENKDTISFSRQAIGFVKEKE